MNDIGQDVRHAVRLLTKRPLLTTIVVSTLALGIGANTAIFSVANALLLRPIALPASQRLVAVFGVDGEGRTTGMSYPDFEDVRREARLFDGFTAVAPQSVNLTGRPEPERVRGGFVSASFFDVVGVSPAIGRGFRAGEDQPGAEGVCVVNHDAWQRVFGGDPQLVGSTIVLNNAPFSVVGIMPAEFRFPYDEVEVWIPYQHWPVFVTNQKSRTNGFVASLARLRADADLTQAQAELTTIASRLADAYPEAGPRRAVRIQPLHELLVEDVEQALLVLLGAVALVLLIACANVGNLLLSQTASRLRELATRSALGARRGRIVRQLLIETAVLWLAGGAAGLVVASWARSALVEALPTSLPGGVQVRLDATVIAYTFALTAATGLAFGLLPALRYSRPNLASALKESARGVGDGASRTRLRSGLVVLQLALTLVLLAGSGLMVRSLQRLAQVDLGFRAERLLTLEYRLPANKYPEGAQQAAFHRSVVERVQAVPGVRAAAAVRALPFSGNGSNVDFELPGHPAAGEPGGLRGQLNTVDAGYFTTMGIPLLRGRVFDAADDASTPPIVVINRVMAERYWPAEDPIGRAVHFPGTPARSATIVGVVGDVKHSALDETATPQLYAVLPQNPHIFNTLVVRSEAEDPLALAAAVRSAVWSVDRDQPVWKVRSLESLVEGSLGMRRFLMQLMGVYSLLALALAALGLYGVIAYAVASRTHEIGVRMALGAAAGDVLELVLVRGLRLAAVGIVAGLLAALALGRAVSGLLFGVSASDPLTLATMAGVLLAVALLASWLPARRATRVDPISALRYE